MPTEGTGVAGNGNSTGQLHDRIQQDAAMHNQSEGASKDADISLGQKMLSAVSGSVLTSLLGMQPSSSIPYMYTHGVVSQ